MDKEKNILRGEKLAITLPPDLSMGQLLLNRLPTHGDRIAAIDGETDEKITYQNILESSSKLAAYLSTQGLKMNDKIAICAENSLNFIIPVCSSMISGLTICPLNPGYSKREFLHALNISKPKVMFVSSNVAKKMATIAQELPWSMSLVSIDESTLKNVPRMKDLIAQSQLSNSSANEACKVPVAEHIFAILCSSGTTGLPKGVLLTDKNFLTVICHLISTVSANVSGTTLSLNLLPFFHAYAFVTMVNQITLGVPIVILSRFEPKIFLSTIQKYKITSLILVPPLMVFLAKNPLVDQYDLSSVQQIWSGAAPLSENIQAAVYQRLNKPMIKQAYGLTETTLGVTKAPPDWNKPGSVGKLAPDMLAKVVALDEGLSQRALGPHQKGELCFKGDLIMKGYCGDSDSTKATVDEDGWLHTGDIGYYDEDGFFFIVDRLKELIKYKGYQVPPAELESILLTHPEVLDAAVVGIPDERSGELPLGFVVKKPQSKVTATEITEFVNGQVSSQKWLRGGVRFVNSIPKTASGKILRRLLRQDLKSKL